MGKIIYVILLLGYCSTSIFSQSNYSKIFDLEYGKYNYLKKSVVQDNLKYFITQHYCESNQRIIECSSISIESEHSRTSHLFQDLIIRGLYVNNNTIYVSASSIKESENTKTYIFQYDQDYNLIDSISIPFEKSVPRTKGLVKIGNVFYEFGLLFDNIEEVQYAYINSISENLDSVYWSKVYKVGSSSTFIKDIQELSANKLITSFYYLNKNSEIERYGYQLVTLDIKNGDLSTSFNYDDVKNEACSFVAARNGSIYFYSIDNILNNIFPTYGQINKIDSSLSNIQWNIELPNDPFTNARKYRIDEIIERKNGNYLAVGEIWDEELDGPLLNGQNHSWHGFILEFSENSDVNWLKIYKHRTDLPALENVEIGDFLKSGIRDVFETPGGDIRINGIVTYAPWQAYKIDPSLTRSYIWNMTVDESGCLHDENCEDEIIEISYNSTPQLVNPNNRWHIESLDFSSGVRYFIYRFSDSFTTQINNQYRELYFKEVGSQTWTETNILYRESEGKIYKYGNDTESIVYNFNLGIGDTFMSPTFDVPDAILEVIDIDTIVMENGELRKRLNLACENYTEDTNIYWINGIGDLKGLVQVEDNCRLDQVSALNCFTTNDTIIYKRISDTECGTVSVSNLDESIDIVVYPNPTTSSINILINEPSQIICTVYSLSGNKMFTTTDRHFDVGNLAAGVYYLLIQVKGERHWQRIVKMP